MLARAITGAVTAAKPLGRPRLRSVIRGPHDGDGRLESDDLLDRTADDGLGQDVDLPHSVRGATGTGVRRRAVTAA